MSQPLGWLMPDVELKMLDTTWSLADAEPYQGLVVLMTCNHCAEAQVVWPLIIDQHWRFQHQLAFLAVNANNESLPLESHSETAEMAQELRLPFPYVADSHHTLAQKLEATCMPEVFVFRHIGPAQFSLYYHGAVGPAFERSLQRLVLKLDPLMDQPPALGCPIPSQVQDAHRHVPKNPRSPKR